MATKFPFSIWNYNTVSERSPEDVNDWAECGLTATMTPTIFYGKDDPASLIPYLDAAESRGIKLIAFIYGLEHNLYGELGRDEYAKRFKEVYNIIKHPALYGFFIGDEPHGAQSFRQCHDTIVLQNELAPELRPYLNLATCMDDTSPEEFDGLTFRQWLRKLSQDVNGNLSFSYGHYDQVWDENGINSYYRNLKALVEAADGAGVDVWNTMLSSAHYMFRIPTEYEIMWQITTAAACGSRGINWFRFYDRSFGPNYHGSPIDEYGNKTELYYAMLRSQRRFNDHYGELIMSLKHTKTYLTHKPYGGYDLFGTNTHPIVTGIRSDEQAVIGFFKAEDGTEYMALVNGSQTTPGVFKIDFDHDKYNVEEVMFNGGSLSPYDPKNSDAHWDGQWLYPGQMNMFRLSAK